MRAVLMDDAVSSGRMMGVNLTTIGAGAWERECMPRGHPGPGVAIAQPRPWRGHPEAEGTDCPLPLLFAVHE